MCDLLLPTPPQLGAPAYCTVHMYPLPSLSSLLCDINVVLTEVLVEQGGTGLTPPPLPFTHGAQCTFITATTTRERKKVLRGFYISVIACVYCVLLSKKV